MITLAGTNCYVVGRGQNRTLIDCCDVPEKNESFLGNLVSFLDDNQGVNLNRILITHAHMDHVGGLNDVLTILKQR
jgi:endoribonuclease LACTB2